MMLQKLLILSPNFFSNLSTRLIQRLFGNSTAKYRDYEIEGESYGLSNVRPMPTGCIGVILKLQRKLHTVLADGVAVVNNEKHILAKELNYL